MARYSIVTAGHSYVVKRNRDVAREIARDPEFSISCGAPARFRGDLRELDLEPEPEGSPLEVVPLPCHLTWQIHTFFYRPSPLRAFLSTRKPALVHAWEEPYIVSGYQLFRESRKAGARFLFRSAQNYVKRYPPPFGAMNRAVFAGASAWVVPGDLSYAAASHYAPGRGTLIPLPLDGLDFRPLAPAARATKLAELGLEGPCIGFLGRFVEEKGISVLLAALDEMRKEKWSVLFLGSGPLEKKIQEWAAARAMGGRVKTMLLSHDEVPRVLPAVDLLAAPSQTTARWREQFGRMTIEAFACGVPVVASRSGELPSVVGEAGLLVDEKDVAGWAAAFRYLLEDAGARAALAERGLKRAELFSVPAIAAKWKEVYRTVLSGAPPR